MNVDPEFMGEGIASLMLDSIGLVFCFVSMFLKGFYEMVKSKRGLVGRYEMVRLENVDDTFKDKRMFIIQGTMEQMCSFYEALKDAMQDAMNKERKEFGITDVAGVHHCPCPDDDLEDWRSEPGEITAYAKAKAQGEREGLMRFAAEESRFTFEGDPYSWVTALESAIASTGIAVEPVSLVV